MFWWLDHLNHCFDKDNYENGKSLFWALYISLSYYFIQTLIDYELLKFKTWRQNWGPMYLELLRFYYSRLREPILFSSCPCLQQSVCECDLNLLQCMSLDFIKRHEARYHVKYLVLISYVVSLDKVVKDADSWFKGCGFDSWSGWMIHSLEIYLISFYSFQPDKYMWMDHN